MLGHLSSSIVAPRKLRVGEAASGWERGQTAPSLTLELKKGEDRGERAKHRAFGVCQTQATAAGGSAAKQSQAPLQRGWRKEPASFCPLWTLTLVVLHTDMHPRVCKGAWWSGVQASEQESVGLGPTFCQLPATQSWV